MLTSITYALFKMSIYTVPLHKWRNICRTKTTIPVAIHFLANEWMEINLSKRMDNRVLKRQRKRKNEVKKREIQYQGVQLFTALTSHILICQPMEAMHVCACMRLCVCVLMDSKRTSPMCVGNFYHIFDCMCEVMLNLYPSCFTHLYIYVYIGMCVCESPYEGRLMPGLWGPE